MVTPKARASSRKQGQRLKELERAQRMLNAKKNGKPAIPDKILRRLASLNLPPNEFVYQACLEKLLRGA